MEVKGFMREITLEELLAAGCHFGHQVTRSNPKARDFIFEARDNIHIIDLAKTKAGLEEAAAFIKALALKGGSLVVVGTKRQAAGIVLEVYKNASEKGTDEGLFYITNRWVGGLLTNLSEVSKNFKKLQDLISNLKDETLKTKYTKKEIGMWDKERKKLESFYGGVFEMKQRPDALFIVDSHLEDLTVREAIATGVATVAIVDTNADPSIIDYPIPANDDAVGSIKLIVDYIMDAWTEGKKEADELKEKSKKKEEVSGKKQETNNKKTKVEKKVKREKKLSRE